MTKIFLVGMTIVTAMSSLSARGTFEIYEEKKSDAPRLCEVFTTKAELYKKHMRKDAYAKATLDAYNKRARIFCAKAQEEAKKEVLQKEK